MKSIFGPALVLCTLLSGCIIENSTNREPDPRTDGGVSMTDGGSACPAACSDDECASGVATLDENCRCVCEVACDDVDCAAIACDDGQQQYQPEGECCPICINQCDSDANCADGEVCNEEGLCTTDCAQCSTCPDGLTPSPYPNDCCACVPECGENSPYVCQENAACEAGRCVVQDVVECNGECACPPGSVTGETPDGECCPECISIDECMNTLCVACPPGTESVGQPGSCCGTCEPINDCTCPEIYSPICGTDGQTYENSCVADCAGVGVRGQGECPQACDCPLLYDPVCARGVTYPNQCLADCANVRNTVPGECGTEPVCDPEDGCGRACDTAVRCLISECGNAPGNVRRELIGSCRDACSDGEFELDVLCSATTCTEVTALTTVLADDDLCTEIACQNPTPGVDYYGIGDECELIDFACPENQEYYTDACGCGCIYPVNECEPLDPGSEYIAYGEECQLIDFQCAPGAEPFYNECGCGCASVCDCPPNGGPNVCTPEGDRYQSPCIANCVGIRDFSVCEDECECPDIYSPVCGADGQTYANQCQARCARARVVSAGECSNSNLCGDDPQALTCDELTPIVYECVVSVCGEGAIERLLDSDQQLACDEFEPVLRSIVCGAEDCERLIESLSDIDASLANACNGSSQCPQDADYINQDPEACALIGAFTCEPGDEPFSNECGCGCAPTTCPEPGIDALYANDDPDVCTQITLECPDGRAGFSNECGCGCYL